MYLQRKIDSSLIHWRENPKRKPLIVKGARQVGKTESLLHFAKENYENVVYINFVEEPKYRMITGDGYGADHIIKNISRIDPSKRFTAETTIIIFDELQEFPEIAASLKFFAIDGRFDVICSGSLLGIQYRRIESNSVGYKTNYEMHSMDFEEFLWSKNYDTDFIETIYDHMKNCAPFSALDMTILNELFLDYCILGGMPAVVLNYIEKNTFEGTLEMQRQLLLDYQEDIRKYADGMDQTRILNVYNQIPIQLSKENKKFQISKVAGGARFKDYRGCIEWLKDAGLINISYCLHTPDLPLKDNFDDTKYKIYFSDTGLLVAMLDEEAQEDLRANKNMNVYKGALYENIVGEALVKCGYSLYYYKRDNSTLEEDFFLRTSSHLIPVEVKAVNGRSKSLRTLIDSSKYPDIEYGIKLCGANIGFGNGIYTFPYFCTFLLKRYLQEKRTET